MIGDLLNTLATAQKLDIAQIQKSIQAGSLPAYIGIPLLQQKMADRQKATAALSGQGQQNQPPIGDRVMAQAQQVAQPGIDHLASNLPEEGYAGGGIIAFNGETDSLVPEDDGDYEDDDMFGAGAAGVAGALAPWRRRAAAQLFVGPQAPSIPSSPDLISKLSAASGGPSPWQRLSGMGHQTYTAQKAAQAAAQVPELSRIARIGRGAGTLGALGTAYEYMGGTPVENAARLAMTGREAIEGIKSLPERSSEILRNAQQWAREQNIKPHMPWEVRAAAPATAETPAPKPAEAQPSALVTPEAKKAADQAMAATLPITSTAAPTLAPHEVSSYFAKAPTVSTSHAGIMAAPGAPKSSAEPEGIAQLAKPADDLFGKEIEANRSERENLRKMILGDEGADREALNKNMWLALAQGGFKAMAGTSPWAMTNLGAGGEEAVKGIAAAKTAHEEAQRKKVEQIATLGLKGQELDNTLRQYGITREYYNAHLPLLAAQTQATLAGIDMDRAKLAIAGARAAGGGSGGVGGIKGLTQGIKAASALEALTTPTKREYEQLDALRENMLAKPEVYAPMLLKDKHAMEKLNSWWTSDEEKDAIKAQLSDAVDNAIAAKEAEMSAAKLNKYRAFLGQ